MLKKTADLEKMYIPQIVDAWHSARSSLYFRSTSICAQTSPINKLILILLTIARLQAHPTLAPPSLYPLLLPFSPWLCQLRLWKSSGSEEVSVEPFVLESHLESVSEGDAEKRH